MSLNVNAKKVTAKKKSLKKAIKHLQFVQNTELTLTFIHL